MQKISIVTTSSNLPSTLIEQINERHQTFIRAVGIDFAETGFFDKTKSDKLEIIQVLSEENKYQIDFTEQPQVPIFKVLSTVPVADFDMENLFVGYQFCQLEAVKTLITILDKFNLEARAFRVRASHIQGEISRSKIERTLPSVPESARNDLQIHVRLFDDAPRWKTQYDFLSLEFIESVESILASNSLGEVEGNDVGEGWFTLFCVGDNPRQMLDKLRDYLKTCIDGSDNFVLIKDELGENKILITDL